MGIVIVNDDKRALAHELLTLSTANVYTLNSAVYTLSDGTIAKEAIIGPVETQAVRYTIHGSNPVVATKVGHLLDTSDFIVVENSADIQNFKVVREAATTAYVPVTYRF